MAEASTTLKLAHVFYVSATPDDVAGWYYQIGSAPPQGPFASPLVAGKACRAEIMQTGEQE